MEKAKLKGNAIISKGKMNLHGIEKEVIEILNRVDMCMCMCMWIEWKKAKGGKEREDKNPTTTPTP